MSAGEHVSKFIVHSYCTLTEGVLVLLYLGNMSTRPLLFWFIYGTGYTLRHSITNVQVRSTTA